MTDTLKVTLFGGPGAGKSTTMALAFGYLKQAGHNIENVPEVAKELVWEERHQALLFQPYIIAKQMWRERRLDGKVDAIITDTSTLFSFIYGGEANGVTPAFKEWVLDDYRRANRLNYFLRRDPTRAYNPNGRTQKSLEEASAHDAEILAVLEDNEIPYMFVQVDKDGNSHVDVIVRGIERKLEMMRDEADAWAMLEQAHVPMGCECDEGLRTPFNCWSCTAR